MTDRHQCEVRHVLALRVIGNSEASRYLARVEEKRGEKVVEELKKDARQQWDLGNRGKWGDWK